MRRLLFVLMLYVIVLGATGFRRTTEPVVSRLPAWSRRVPTSTLRNFKSIVYLRDWLFAGDLVSGYQTFSLGRNEGVLDLLAQRWRVSHLVVCTYSIRENKGWGRGRVGHREGRTQRGEENLGPLRGWKKGPACCVGALLIFPVQHTRAIRHHHAAEQSTT